MLSLLLNPARAKMPVMKLLQKARKSGLDKKFQKVIKTPASFDFYVAIHDFIDYIESNAPMVKSLQSSSKLNRELKIPDKYNHLRRIHQGLEDADNKSGDDLGHARYAVLIELNRIKNKEASESNSFWKKRELFRKFTSDIYARLNPDAAEVKAASV